MDALDQLAFSFPTMVRVLLRLLPKLSPPSSTPAPCNASPPPTSARGSVGAGPTCPDASCRRRAGEPPWPHVLLTLEFQATADRHMALRVETCTALLRQDLLRKGREEGRAEGIRRGREEGRAEERALLLRLTARRFGAGTAEALGRLLEGVDDADRLAEVGEMIVDCRTGGALLDRVRQEPGRG